MRLTIYCTRVTFVDVLSLSNSLKLDRSVIVQQMIDKTVNSMGLSRLPDFLHSDLGLLLARRVLFARNERRLPVRVEAQPLEVLRNCSSFSWSKCAVFLLERGLDLHFCGESRPSSVAAGPAHPIGPLSLLKD